ncbi:putative oxidoreductase, Zn-dependent and NAD(P)-binding [Methylocella tundrae]|uniref:Putative oxidoreductase, Zn-dependent and NAD(P)-binding n=1 Tax=Methylocella tundrae TaxID=227605 RepID=A0A8B6M6E0_METTU|nr:MDR family oxidoreductase [Methylocella tundrae]VTZ25387.1 putative oxidoreductase, Zn-dependent and NAD(P)-binding [Methylocella tundrae]VTZ50316.1 putative oxidoreductase, Zn-dependent and NAD(P)-binding [Methylocella tundrae]
MFKGLLTDKAGGSYATKLTQLDEAQLPDGDVTVRVAYSTLNYKDALAITGRFPVVRHFPMVPGIDLVGAVEDSGSPKFKRGDLVLVNGFGIGDVHWGGLAERARLKSDWLIPLPKAFTPRQAMAIGTAGYTAMLCVMALEHNGVTPDKGEVLVTGAAGGVGSIAIALLHKLGYAVVASTGRAAEADYLKGLGAREVIDRAKLSSPGEPLQKERWAGAIDSVGSHTLANVLAAMRYGGAAAACGLAQGLDLPGSVAPFILRGVTLAGIDSVYRPMPDRLEAWRRLSSDLDTRRLDSLTHQIGLDETIGYASKILEGAVRGRLVVAIDPGAAG